MILKKLFIIILIVFISGCVEEPIGEVGSSEQIGEDAEIVVVEESNGYEIRNIKYEKDDKEYESYFLPELRDALDWIKENAEGEVFLSWWDYGHMIRGYTGNEAVIYSPSEDILWSLASGKWDEEGSGEFSSEEEIDDVVLALTTFGPDNTKRVMEKYNAEYIFVTSKDSDLGFVLFKIAGLEDYIGEDYKPKEKAYSTMLFRMIEKEEIEGFELVYSDEIVRIYRLI